MSERVQVTIDNAVATVRLSRPDKLNALDAEMFEAVIRAGEQILADQSVRAVVLHGEGRAFSAGLDFASFMGKPDLMQKLLARSEKSPANVAQRIAWIWQEVHVPVIAAVHGVAFGGGLQIALGADLRYVAADAQLSVLEIKWGLIPDMSISQTLTRLVPLDVAKELTFTGRVVSGSEAVELGLATKVSADPLADALETAKIIATKSPHAIRAGKALLNDAPSMSRADALKLETALQVGLLGSPNQMEAVEANMMKRQPNFKDPD
ncbi:MAG: crotonase/enoyl-CoA hydratase family protein [Deltaproteobacteria bacterium]|jgi:enoyl-CoA hydratase/carnithine racemase|nr:crotonase/enoyl-CoA hydratase family protein [Deltaproteobacteria bacterium]